MSYKTVMMEPHHRPMVRDLWQENLQGIGSSGRLDERLAWLYDRSPDGPAVTALVLSGDDPTPVACGTVLPRRVLVKGSEVLAGIPIDFAVSKRHRIGGAALMLQRRLAALVDEGRFAFLLAYPNKLALPVFQRIGYKKVGDAQAWVKPLRAGYKLRRYLRNPVFTAVAAVPANGLMAAIDRVRCRSRVSVRRETQKTADERFDSLWGGAAANFPLTTVRSSAYLNWRYAGFTTMEYQLFTATDPASGALVGYVAYSTDGPKASVADLFARTTAEAFEVVLPAFVQQMRRRRADTVFFAYVGGDEVAAHLKRLGFFYRPDNPRALLAYVGAGKEDDFVLHANNWFATDGEVDI